MKTDGTGEEWGTGDVREECESVRRIETNGAISGSGGSHVRWKSWREAVAYSYARALKEIDEKPPRWETYDDHWNFPPANDWRLWESIEVLDINHTLLRNLARRARRKHKQDLAIRIDQVSEYVSLALTQLDPDNWPKRFVDFKTDSKRLKAAADCLQQALMLFRDGYGQISVEVEADRGINRPWFKDTPVIYRQLRRLVCS